MSSDSFKAVVDEVCELVRRSAHPRRRTLSVSPEVAALLDSIEVPGVASPAVSAPAPGLSDDERVAQLKALEVEVSVCRQCGLSESRTQTVFGTGSADAELVFVGEAPGADEDAQGKPFVGRSGQLLTDMIEKGMKIARDDVFICNVLKCRPPDNRDPRPDEKELCEPYLLRQLELLRPKVICTLGKHAAQTLLKTDAPIGHLRGEWHFYHGIPLRVTYHPAYLLRSPSEKKKAWTDLQEIMKVLRGEVKPVA